MNINDLVAIDIHTHAEVSCRQPYDDYGKEFDEAASKYFKFDKRPTIDETVAYYRNPPRQRHPTLRNGWLWWNAYRLSQLIGHKSTHLG